MRVSIPEAIEAFARGEMLIVTDDEDRENEGDLFVAASHCTSEQMAFLVRYTSGIVCAPLSSHEARRLHLEPMVSVNDAPLNTAFTISVDARDGLTTGISAVERARTVRALADQVSAPEDFARPGHVFPLIANAGGVLMRAGHTEACVDLCTMAKLPPVGVIAELVNDDGTVMRGNDIDAFAVRHRLKCVSIADLIAYRLRREQLVTRISTFCMPLDRGELTVHVYATPFDRVQHFAFVRGTIGDGCDVPARLHRADVLTDVFGGAKVFWAALRRFEKEGRGVLVYLRDGAAGVPTSTPDDALQPAWDTMGKAQWRDVGLGAQILRDLGVSSIVNLTSNPEREFVGLSGFGVIISRCEIVPEECPYETSWAGRAALTDSKQLL
jgi:3,4-dihydroxy 2-butanone 4-phosphate synthase/GTP cyclohydrolase II